MRFLVIKNSKVLLSSIYKYIFSESVEDTFCCNIHKILSKYQKLIYCNLPRYIFKICLKKHIQKLTTTENYKTISFIFNY